MMRRYFLLRLCLLPALVLLISLVAFALMNLAPSDPAEVALRVNNIVPTAENIAEMHRTLGLDQPFLTRYLSWLGQIFHLDLGRSFLNHRPVLQEMWQAFPVTLQLAAVTFVWIFLLALPLALLCVWLRHGKGDSVIRAILFIFTAIPNYWLALLFIWGFAVQLDWFPVSGNRTSYSLILPALTLSFGYIGTYVRLIRGAMLNQLQQPYVFYAQARGLSLRRILLRHVLPNSLHTFLVALGMGIPKLLAGAVVIENIFALPGLGRLCIQAILGRDYPMLQGYILFISLFFLLANFFVDLLQYQRDPRLWSGRK